MYCAYIVLIGDVYGALVYDISGVYFVLKEECGDARALIAIDNGPVDGRRRRDSPAVAMRAD